MALPRVHPSSHHDSLSVSGLMASACSWLLRVPTTASASSHQGFCMFPPGLLRVPSTASECSHHGFCVFPPRLLRLPTTASASSHHGFCVFPPRLLRLPTKASASSHHSLPWPLAHSPLTVGGFAVTQHSGWLSSIFTVSPAGLRLPGASPEEDSFSCSWQTSSGPGLIPSSLDTDT